MTDNKEQESQQVANASAEGTDDKPSWQGKLDVKEDDEQKWQPDKWQPGQMQDTTNGKQVQSSGPKISQLRGSRASIAGPAADKSRREPVKTNPGRIPTAGGQVMGQRASEARAERRASRVSEDLSPPSPKVDKTGSPDPVTEDNTVSNANGEGSSRMASVTEDEEGGPKDPNAKPQDESTAAKPENGAAVPAISEPTEKKDEKTDVKTEIKDKLSPSSGKATDSPTKERRGSTMENLKAKFKKLGS